MAPLCSINPRLHPIKRHFIIESLFSFLLYNKAHATATPPTIHACGLAVIIACAPAWLELDDGDEVPVLCEAAVPLALPDWLTLPVLCATTVPLALPVFAIPDVAKVEDPVAFAPLLLVFVADASRV